MCVGVRVRRSKTGLSERVSLGVSSGVCGGQASQIQDGGCHTGCRWRCRLVCVWGSGFADPKTGAVTEGVVGGVVWCVGGQASQIQDGAVTQGVVGGVVWCVCGARVCRSKAGLSHRVSLEVSSGVCVGSGFADPRRGCHTGCRWRCRLVCVGVRLRRSKTGLSQRVSLEVSSGVCVGVRVRRSKTGLSQGVVGGVVWCVWGSGFADPRRGCHRGCRWRCRLVCVWGSGFADPRPGSHRVSLEVSSGPKINFVCFVLHNGGFALCPSHPARFARMHLAVNF